MSYRITCDRSEEIARAAVWKDGALCDLYVDRLDAPDMTGAKVCGRVVRTLAGQKTAWLDAGLAEKIFVESKKPIKTGALLTLLVRTTMGEGKAWQGVLVEGEDTPAREGIIMPPPPVWMRALQSLKDAGTVTGHFAAREDYQLCHSLELPVKAVLVDKEPVHPQPDEMIDALRNPIVTIAGGASLVIEQTAALVAIDVNAGTSTNPTATNLLAVREAARQVRLRNLSGIIVIDCLKVGARADVAKVVHAFERVAAEDPCAIRCAGIGKIGLLEATRERRGPSLAAVMGDA